MNPVYTALLRANQLEWNGAAPAVPEEGLPVQVIPLPAVPTADAEADRKARRAAVMERIAARGGITSIPDPLAWERELRQDKPLPGREE